MAVDGSPVLPGRLGSPGMALRDDPRADPRMIAAMEPFGLADPPADAPVDSESPIEALLEYVTAAEEGFEALFDALVGGLPGIAGVTGASRSSRASTATTSRCTSTAPTSDGGALPGVLHLHGGGMVLLEAAGAAYGRWRDELAATGLVVVGVEFRNGGGKHGASPVPGRPQRLRVGAAVGDRQQGRARDLHAHRVRRVGRRQPHPRHDAEGQARRPGRPDRRRLRDVPVHLGRLRLTAARADLALTRTTGTSSAAG